MTLYVMDLGAVAIKGHFVFFKAPGLEPHHQICLVSYLGHSLGVSYPSAEMQSVYSTDPADWACSGINIVTVKMQ